MEGIEAYRLERGVKDVRSTFGCDPQTGPGALSPQCCTTPSSSSPARAWQGRVNRGRSKERSVALGIGLYPRPCAIEAPRS